MITPRFTTNVVIKNGIESGTGSRVDVTFRSDDVYNDPVTCLALAKEEARTKAEFMNKTIVAVMEDHGFADFTVVFKFILADKAPEQPQPVPNDNPAIWDLVVNDMCQRDRIGQARYGTRLQPFNGRDALRDAYEEMLDAAVYIRQALFERDGK